MTTPQQPLSNGNATGSNSTSTGIAADATTGPKVNVALIQIRAPSEDVPANCVHMREMVRQAVKEGAERGADVHLAVLGEIWNVPLSAEPMKRLAEPVPAVEDAEADWPAGATTTRELAAAAREAGIWLVGGSIPERVGDKVYNVSTVWSPEGKMVHKYRKTHLFDIDMPKMRYYESDTITPGESLAMFDTPFGRFGLAICYDIRFPEIATIAARKGCKAMFYPAAFNCVTGPMHWELLQRGRALDNQIYVATCSPARDDKASYVVYGHSMAVSPQGEVLGDAGTDEAILHVTVDPAVIADTRARIPVYTQRRWDLYSDVAGVRQ